MTKTILSVALMLFCGVALNVLSGKIEPAEVKESLLRLGVNIDLAEADRLTQRSVCCALCILCLQCPLFVSTCR